MTKVPSVKEQLGVFIDVLSHLVGMVEKARSAFNRQSHGELEEMVRLKGMVSEEIALVTGRLDNMLAETEGTERQFCVKLYSVLTHIQLMAEDIGEMVPALKKQIGEAIPFSQKGIAQTNELFEGQLELLRVLGDVFRTDNEVLKTFVQKEKGPSLCQQCIDFATDHEARMVEGLCLPHAAPVFLALLDSVRTMARHGMEVAHLLTPDQRS